MSSHGFIYLHRQLLNWEWYQDHKTTRLFIHLLLVANHKMNSWQGIEIKRGQTVTGLYSLSEQTGISVQSIRTSLKRLKSTRDITIKTHSKFSIVTIKNYAQYQTNNRVANKQLTSNQQATNNQLTTNNNDNNDNNDNNEEEGSKKKHTHLEFVKLTKAEHVKLVDANGEIKVKDYIERLNGHIGSKGDKYKSHYHTILNWIRRDKNEAGNNWLDKYKKESE